METTIDITPLLAELRSIIDQREQLASQDKALSERRSVLERQLLDYHNSSGLDSIAGAGLGVSFDNTAMRATYEPAKWAEIVKWAVETGHEYIVQRRLTDAKIIDLHDKGVAFPPGLGLESYTKLSIRRK